MASRPASMRLAMAISPSRDKQFDRAHLAQIHAHGIVGALGRLLLLGDRERLRFRFDQVGAGVVVIVVGGLVGGLLLALLGVGVLVVDDVDAHLAEHRHDVFDLLGRGGFRRQHGVERVEGDEAALLGGLDHLLDAGIGQVEQRQRGIGSAFGVLLRGLFLRLRRLHLARHSRLSWAFLWAFLAYARGSLRHQPANGQKRPRRRRRPESGRQCRRNVIKFRLTLNKTAEIDLVFHAGPAFRTGPRSRPPRRPSRRRRHAHKLRAPRPEEAPKPSIRASVPSISDRRALTSRNRK